MNRARKPILTRLWLLPVVVLVLTACGSTGSSGSQAASASGGKTGSVTIGLDLYSQIEPRWQYDKQYAQAEADKLGDKLIITWANNDSTKQSNNVDSLITQGVDVLAVAPVDVKAAGALVDKAKQAGIPFVDYDISLSNSVPDYVVVRNQDEACQMQFDAAYKFAPSGNWALIEGDAGNDLAQACDKVYSENVAKHPEIKVVYKDWTPRFDTAEAKTDAENILTQNNDNITAFLTTNDSMALGVIQALTARNLNGKVFVSGLNADPPNLKAIAAGDQMMTIWTPIDVEAKAAIDAADALARGKAPTSTGTFTNSAGQAPAYFVANVPVDKTTLCDYLTKEAPPGSVTVSDIFPNNPNACGS